MLKTRIITAVVLLVLFLGALFYLPPLGWAAFVTAIAVIAAWEWGGLLLLGSAPRLALCALVFVCCAAIGLWQPGALGLGADFGQASWLVGRLLYLPAGIFWACVVPFWMRGRWRLSQPIIGSMVGLVVLLPTWLALIQLKQAGGGAGLLAVMAIVWVADIAAYFCGRRFGRRKLAPSISPGKTWEGAIGATFAVVAYGFFLSYCFPKVVTVNHLAFVLILVAVTAISVVGDLFESLLKRQAGLKDSGSILPGHGGVLDRIDSLTSTLPLVALVWLLNQS